LSLVGEHREAIDQYERAAELYDEVPIGLLINWANSLGVLGRYEEMENTARFAVERAAGGEGEGAGGEDGAAASRAGEAWERLGFALFRRGSYEEAGRAFRRAIELDARNAAALNGLGIVVLNAYVETDRRDEGLRIRGLNLLNRSLRIDPNQDRIVDLVARFRRG
jgi:tetratricopeptide (TPR) repeat protein